MSEPRFDAPSGLLQSAVAAFQDGQLDRAMTLCDLVLRGAPRHPDALLLRALLHHRANQPKQAMRVIERALAARPAFPQAFFTLGVMRQEAGAFGPAAVAYRRAVELDPGHVPAWANLGLVLRRAGRLEEALAAHARAAELEPANPDLQSNLGNILVDLERLEDAAGCFHRAAALAPGDVEIWRRLAAVLSRQGQCRDAIQALSELRALTPDDGTIDPAIGRLMIDMEAFDDAITFLEGALASSPEQAALYDLLGLAKAIGLGLTDEGRAAFLAAHERQPAAYRASNLLLVQHYSPIPTPEALFEAHQAWQRDYEEPVEPLSLPRWDRDAQRRLRVGFVSKDLHNHAVSRFLLPLLEAMDGTAWEIVCYSTGGLRDEISERLRAAAHQWRELFKRPGDSARDILEDRVDILIDLSGHTAPSLEIFAHKPAPLQVTWLGYPDTTGLSRIDYRLTDAMADPPGESDQLNSERLIRLPSGFLCFDPLFDTPPVGPGPAARNGFVTFGCFNNLAKIGTETIAAWAAILHAVPASRLMIRRTGLASPAARARLIAGFAQHGIDATRLQLDPGGREDYLEAYHAVDIVLDSFPYNGTTTTCEALWMGVPVVTLRGDRHSARVGASLLSHAGLGEFIGDSVAAFVSTAQSLASDLDGLGELRHSLRERVKASPLCDAPLFARNVEAALREIWSTWCAGTPLPAPQGFMSRYG